jgi:hypothetical protein
MVNRRRVVIKPSVVEDEDHIVFEHLLSHVLLLVQLPLQRLQVHGVLNHRYVVVIEILGLVDRLAEGPGVLEAHQFGDDLPGVLVEGLLLALLRVQVLRLGPSRFLKAWNLVKS